MIPPTFTVMPSRNEAIAILRVESFFMPRHTHHYSINPITVPDTADQFTELEDLFEQIEEVRDLIIDTFNQSQARAMLGGFVRGEKADLRIEWNDAAATVIVPLED